MYVSNDDLLSIDIEEMNATTSDEVTWRHGYQDDDVVKTEFQIENRSSQYTLQNSIKQLQNEIEEKTDFGLTGVEYDINEHEGNLVFSSIKHIDPNKHVGELLSQNPDSITIPKTLAYENTVTCTGAFVAFFDWGYRVDQLKLKQGDGMYITAAPQEKHQSPTPN